MKYLALYNSDDGFIVAEVDGKKSTICKNAFVYKDESDVYHLVDINTGLSIVKSSTMESLKTSFARKKKEYEKYLKTETYQIKCERFEKMKLVSNYGKDH